jgi:GMP synthase (glutamine-hydrolysing)
MAGAVLVVQHEDGCPPARLGTVLDAAGLPWELVALDRGDRLPGLGPWRGIVSLGGRMGAYDTGEFPFLLDEARLLAEADRAGVPVLGLCLGGQLLAGALGGRAHLGPRPEVGYHPVRLTAAGRADPVLRHLDGPVLSWHQDTFELPPGAELLAASDAYPHAFRRGASVGLQFHPEADRAVLGSWVGDAGPDGVRAWGGDPDALLARADADDAAIDRAGTGVLAAWAATLGGH